MESDTLEEIIEKSQINTMQEDESAPNMVNEIASFNKPLSINNDFYNVDNEDLEFILNQEYEFNPNSKESKSCEDLFQVDDIPDDTNSEIIPLNPELVNLKKNESTDEYESNLNNDVSFSENTNSTEAINEIINDLIERVDQKTPPKQLSSQLPSTGNVSRITIQKLKEIEPKNSDTNQTSNDTTNTFESIINNLKSSQTEKKSIALVESLEVVKRPKPNILKKNRHSLPSSTKFKSMHISEILKIYGGSAPKPEIKKTIFQNEVSSAKTRIRQKTSIIVEKKTHVELIREYLDSNNNVIRQEKIDEKDHRDVLQNLNNDKILSYKSSKLPSIDELSSSSSINLNELLDDKKVKKNNSAKKSYKLALSNRYRNQSPETPKQAKKRPVRAKRQKSDLKSTPKENNNFSFSNLRFNLTPQERKKDLLELKNGIESEKEISSPSKESLIEETIVNKKIGNFLLEFGNEMQQLVTNGDYDDKKLKVNSYVPMNRISESDYEYYIEKYKNEMKKPKTKFNLGDRVFVPVGNFFLPALVTDIQSMRKSQSSSFFNTSSSEVYYSYGCRLTFKSDDFKPSDEIVYENENLIIRHDWLKENDSILVYSFRDSRFVASSLLGISPKINKSTQINDFIVKQYRSRYRKLLPFQLIGLSQDEGEKILKRVLNNDIKSNIGKSPSKKFSYVNRVFDPIYTESESDLSPRKRKSDDEYINEPELEASEDNYNLFEKQKTKKKRRSYAVKRRRYSKIEIVEKNKNLNQIDLSKPGEEVQIDISSSHNDSNTSLVSNNSLNLTVCRAVNNLTNSDSQRKKRTLTFASKNLT